MSVSASCLCVRNLLRAGLTAFPGLNQAIKNTGIMVMPDERPAPACGQEFIAIYADEWSPFNSGGADQELYGLHEIFRVCVAVTHRTGLSPHDRIGEVDYIKDEDVYVSQYYSIEQRIREINKLIHSDYSGQFAQFTTLLPSREQPYEKLSWTGSDPRPTIVGAAHFHASPNQQNPPSGLLMKTYFRGAMRLHYPTTIDEASV